jgi:hypothetical protein
MAKEFAAAYLAEAVRLRALAAGSATDIGRAALLEMAEEYEALAAKAADPPALPTDHADGHNNQADDGDAHSQGNEHSLN